MSKTSKKDVQKSEALLKAEEFVVYAENRWGKDNYRYKDAQKYVEDVKEAEHAK